jgi:hypothetical protein
VRIIAALVAPTKTLTLAPEDVHALSNHLAVILGFVELMIEDAMEAPHRDDLLEIRSAAVQAARIIGRHPKVE